MSSQMPSETDCLARLVKQWERGDQSAVDRLMPLLYDELRMLARHQLRSQPKDRTLDTTALVHETYLRIASSTGPEWRGRPQFFALLSKVMRRVLVDAARRRTALKRGGGQIEVSLPTEGGAIEDRAFELLALHQALERLATLDERMARIVECRFFGGLTEREIAEALAVSERTVERQWRRARLYLLHSLAADSVPTLGSAAERG